MDFTYELSLDGTTRKLSFHKVYPEGDAATYIVEGAERPATLQFNQETRHYHFIGPVPESLQGLQDTLSEVILSRTNN